MGVTIKALSGDESGRKVLGVDKAERKKTNGHE